MAVRSNLRELLLRRLARSGPFAAALAGAVALVGCSEGKKFEARRGSEEKVQEERTTNRSDSAFSILSMSQTPERAEVAEVEPASHDHDVHEGASTTPHPCAPDTILTGATAGVPDTKPASEPLRWPGASTAATPAARTPPAAAKPLLLTAPNAPAPTPAVHSAVVTLAELSNDRPQTALPITVAVPTPAPVLSSASRIPPSNVNVDALMRQAEEHNRAGLVAATKGAFFSARTDFLAALRLVAAAQDARRGTQEHTAALAAGLTALTEAEDFVPLREHPESSADVSLAVRSHTTQILDEDTASAMAPAAVHELYVQFSRQRLAFAAAGSRTGSVALHRLGKVATTTASQASTRDPRSKARAFYETALIVDRENFPAANDLAVQLTEDGEYDRAIGVLREGLARSPQPAMWNNLASIHDRRREPQLAEAARREARSLASRGNAAGAGVLPTHNVAWVDNRTFAAASRPNLEMQTAPTQVPGAGMTPRAAPPVAQVAPASAPVPQRAPISTALTPRRNAMIQ